MHTPSTSERLRYWFEGVMSTGTVALVGLLAVITLVLGVRVNPPKQQRMRFAEGDRILVLAES